MSDGHQPVVLIAMADADLAVSYADWLDDGFDVHVVDTAAEAIDYLEFEPTFVLLDRRLPDRPGEEVLSQLRAAGLESRVALLTPRDVELAELDVETVATYPETEAEFEAMMDALRDASGLERAVRSYRRLAERRTALAEASAVGSPERDAEYRTLTAKLEAQRDRIVARLDRLARNDDPTEAPDDAVPTAADDQPADPREEPFTVVEKFRQSEKGPWLWLRAGLVPFLLVLLLFGLLFAATGTWPAVVGVASDSMAPEIQPGDLIVLTAPSRNAPEFAENGIVSSRVARSRDYRSFGGYGSVIVYQPPGSDGSPTIHRVHFAVEAGENWYDRADEAFLEGRSCGRIQHCPAPHDGYITKGDNNQRYDQSSGLAPPVKREWVMGVAKYRIPIGEVRELLLRSASSGLIAPH